MADRKFRIMPYDEYSQAKKQFADPEMIEDLREMYGTSQVTAAIRNGRREFLESPQAKTARDATGNRLSKEVGTNLTLPINDEELDTYLRVLRGEEEKSSLRRDTLALIQSVSKNRPDPRS